MAIAALEGFGPYDIPGQVSHLLGELAPLPWDGLPDDVLVSCVAELESARARLAAAEVRAVAEVERRNLARRRLGWGSTTDWFTHLAGLRRGAGARFVADAMALVGEQEATLEQMAAGDVSPEQAGALLLDRAAHLSATDLHRTSGQVLEHLDPDGTARREEERRAQLDRVAHRRRFLSITDDGCGGVRVRGRGTVEDAAVLRAALIPLTAPVASVDPETGERTSDPRDHGARLWDALVRTAQHALDTDLPPESHGARTRVAVTVPLDVLTGALDADALTEDGLSLSAAAVRRLACDCDLVPVTLGAEGEVLDVGRQTRVVPVGLWRALVVRDGGCTFPGCSRPPVMCHAHHVVPWAEGGDTALGNLAMLCGVHHRLVHDSPWQARLAHGDARPEFLPPPGSRERTDDATAWIRHRRRPASGLAPEPPAPR